MHKKDDPNNIYTKYQPNSSDIYSYKKSILLKNQLKFSILILLVNTLCFFIPIIALLIAKISGLLTMSTLLTGVIVASMAIASVLISLCTVTTDALFNYILKTNTFYIPKELKDTEKWIINNDNNIEKNTLKNRLYKKLFNILNNYVTITSHIIFLISKVPKDKFIISPKNNFGYLQNKYSTKKFKQLICLNVLLVNFFILKIITFIFLIALSVNNNISVNKNIMFMGLSLLASFFITLIAISIFYSINIASRKDFFFYFK